MITEDKFPAVDSIKRKTPEEVMQIAENSFLSETELGHQLIDYKTKGWSWLECALFIKTNQKSSLTSIVKTMNENIAWCDIDDIYEEPQHYVLKSDKESKKQRNQAFIDMLTGQPPT